MSWSCGQFALTEFKLADRKWMKKKTGSNPGEIGIGSS